FRSHDTAPTQISTLSLHDALPILITPWNFPLAIPTWKIMPALIAGNTVVFKPASYTPRMAVRLVEIFQEAGLPDGVINLVMGSGDRKSTRLNSSHVKISYAVFCLK